jgi:hypothetical protein
MGTGRDGWFAVGEDDPAGEGHPEGVQGCFQRV